MIAYCGRPTAASFCDRFPYIGPSYARETIAEICSLRVALATAIMSQTGSLECHGQATEAIEPVTKRPYPGKHAGFACGFFVLGAWANSKTRHKEARGRP